MPSFGLFVREWKVILRVDRRARMTNFPPEKQSLAFLCSPAPLWGCMGWRRSHDNICKAVISRPGAAGRAASSGAARGFGLGIPECGP
jgi:hypothetical protein